MEGQGARSKEGVDDLMKPSTVVLAEMTTLEVDAFLAEHSTVLVPVGSTEQRGPHAPLETDALVAREVARRVAPQVGAVVVRSIDKGLRYLEAVVEATVRLLADIDRAFEAMPAP